MKYDQRARFGIYYLHWNQQRSSCLEHSYVGRWSKILISKSEFFNQYRIQLYVEPNKGSLNFVGNICEKLYEIPTINGRKTVKEFQMKNNIIE